MADLKRANLPQDESAVGDLRRKWSTIPKIGMELRVCLSVGFQRANARSLSGLPLQNFRTEFSVADTSANFRF